jgi:DNA polymerase III delta subunit
MNSQKIKEVMQALENIEYDIKEGYYSAALMEIDIIKEMLKNK